MAQGVYSKAQPDSDGCSCVGGIAYKTCTHCGGHARKRDKCKRCGGTGMTGSPCPVHAANIPADTYVGASNQPAYDGNVGYGANAGYGQQGYGSTSGC